MWNSHNGQYGNERAGVKGRNKSRRSKLKGSPTLGIGILIALIMISHYWS